MVTHVAVPLPVFAYEIVYVNVLHETTVESADLLIVKFGYVGVGGGGATTVTGTGSVCFAVQCGAGEATVSTDGLQIGAGGFGFLSSFIPFSTSSI